MRLLFAIPHYFDPSADGGHGSLRRNQQARLDALTATVAGLHQLFGARQYMIDIARRHAFQIRERADAVVDVVICTAGGQHILDAVPLPSDAYRHHPTDAEPTLLGFECQAVLRDAVGEYDYYCYMEDDLVLRDPWFFVKLGWFTDMAGDAALLQPNRYERDMHGGGRKAYVDGDLRPDVTAPFQEVHDQPTLSGQVMGTQVTFHRPLNPHSGCYFLNARQMAVWAEQPHFLDRDTSFVGPLESAATLGAMRTFRIYKPAPGSASLHIRWCCEPVSESAPAPPSARSSVCPLSSTNSTSACPSPMETMAPRSPAECPAITRVSST